METTSTTTRFSLIPALQKELAEENAITRQFLALVPEDKYDWKPHPKSMSMSALAMHIADLPSWIALGVHTDELDFAKSDWEPKPLGSNAALLATFDKSVETGVAALDAADESRFGEPWLLRTGDTIHATMTRYEMIRHAYSQTAHHRAQLGVYFRLLDIPLPGTYGPSADATDF